MDEKGDAMSIKLTVPGPPVAKGRPRMTRGGIACTPNPTRIAEAYIRSLFVAKYPHHVALDGPLEMTVLAFFAIPKSASRALRAQMILGGVYPTKRPDGDNILKLCEDALNGVAYKDDSQLVSVSIDKRYSENPHVEIKITAPGEEE